MTDIEKEFRAVLESFQDRLRSGDRNLKFGLLDWDWTFALQEDGSIRAESGEHKIWAKPGERRMLVAYGSNPLKNEYIW